MTKGCIYYTVNKVDPMIMEICQKQVLKSFDGDIVSASTKPIDFGRNFCLPDLKRSYPGMVKRILTGLENLNTDYVFFLEDDILYHPSHFDFTPPRDDTYYYNYSNWRWEYPKDRAIKYDTLTSLSMLCCNRQLALNHFQRRMDKIMELKIDWNHEREQIWARRWGYEPGTKRTGNGGFSDEPSDRWYSEFPNIDIRHRNTYTLSKTHLEEFIHIPTGFTEIALDKIPGWNLKELFNL